MRGEIRYALCEREHPVRNLGWSFGTEESEQRPSQKQDHVKPTSKEMRINRGANSLFHLLALRSLKNLLLKPRQRCRGFSFADKHRSAAQQCQMKRKVAVALASASNENKMSDGG